MISENKIDNSFPLGKVFSTWFQETLPWLAGEGNSLYVREDIPSSLLTVKIKPIEGILLEKNLVNNK